MDILEKLKTSGVVSFELHGDGTSIKVMECYEEWRDEYLKKNEMLFLIKQLSDLTNKMK